MKKHTCLTCLTALTLIAFGAYCEPPTPANPKPITYVQTTPILFSFYGTIKAARLTYDSKTVTITPNDAPGYPCIEEDVKDYTLSGNCYDFPVITLPSDYFETAYVELQYPLGAWYHDTNVIDRLDASKSRNFLELF